MECQRCGLSNAEAARFCPGCGAALDSLPGSVLTTERPGPGGTLASISYTEQHPAGAPRTPDYPAGAPRLPDFAGTPRVPEYPAVRTMDAAAAHSPGLRPPAAVTTPPSNEVIDLVPRPESMRPPAPDIAFAPRNQRPAASGVAHLAVISQDGSTGQTHWIEQGTVDIGRDEGEIRLTADRFVSPRHARVFARGSTFVLKDLGSQNGVYLRVRDSEPLNDSDLLLLGSEVLRFDLLSGGERELGPARERGTDVYGSPARPRYACLTERTVEGVSRNVFYISADEVVIGREFGDLVFTTDSFMSRRHAAIQRDPAAGTFTLRDLGSSNGTYLAIRGEVELREGDHLRVGQHLFRFGFGS